MTTEKQTVRKQVQIRAPKEKVWEVLLDDRYTPIWYAEFSPGAKAETDWQQGSKAVFTDESGSGIVGRVTEHRPAEALSLSFEGIVIDGREDYESEEAQKVKGYSENYRLSEQGGVTHLSIAADMSSEYFDSMAESWEKALQKIKSLAE